MTDPLAALLYAVSVEAYQQRRWAQAPWPMDLYEFVADRLREQGVTLAAPPSDAAAPLRTWESMYAEHVRLRDAIHTVATVCSDPSTERHPHYCHFDCDWFADQLSAALEADR